MNRITRLAAVAALGVGLAVAVPASPAAAAACPDPGSGVTVVVDFGGLGGGVTVRCAPGNPSTGLAALTGAGFGWEFWERQPGLVCRIDGLPDPCNGAPTGAYWSYWFADRGGSWQYSSRGAGSRDPAPGTVEGWAFGAAGQPGVPPPAPPEPPAPPPPKPPPDDPPAGDDPPSDQHPPASGGDPSGGGDRPPAGADGPGDRPAEQSPPGGASPTVTGLTGPTRPGGGPASGAAVPGDPAARTTGDGGSLAGVLVTAGLVGVLAAVGWWTARRRRHRARAAGDDLPARTG